MFCERFLSDNEIFKGKDDEKDAGDCGRGLGSDGDLDGRDGVRARGHPSASCAASADSHTGPGANTHADAHTGPHSDARACACADSASASDGEHPDAHAESRRRADAGAQSHSGRADSEPGRAYSSPDSSAAGNEPAGSHAGYARSSESPDADDRGRPDTESESRAFSGAGNPAARELQPGRRPSDHAR